MCVHPTKAGEQCKRSPDEDLCPTHLVNLVAHPINATTASVLSQKIDLDLVHAALDPGRVNWMDFRTTNPTDPADPARAGYFYNGSDFMGKVVLSPKCNRYFIETRDGDFMLLAPFYTTFRVEEDGVLHSGVFCGNCRKKGRTRRHHSSVAEVRACYAAG